METKTKVLDNGTRIIFKGDMKTTIAILPDGAKGVARCNPTDTYSEDEGEKWAIQYAHERAQKAAQRHAKWLQIRPGDKVRFTTNAFSDSARAKLKGEEAIVISQMADDLTQITVQLYRKVPFITIGRGPSVRLVYENTLDITTDMVEKVKRR